MKVLTKSVLIGLGGMFFMAGAGPLFQTAGSGEAANANEHAGTLSINNSGVAITSVSTRVTFYSGANCVGLLGTSLVAGGFTFSPNTIVYANKTSIYNIGAAAELTGPITAVFSVSVVPGYSPALAGEDAPPVFTTTPCFNVECTDGACGGNTSVPVILNGLAI